MKTMKKRLIAALCATALISGLCLTDNKLFTQASSDTTETAAVEYEEHRAAKPGTAPEIKKPGYIFAGWYQDAECTKVLEKEVTEDDNTTVYAKIVPKEVLDVKAQYLTNDGMIADCEEMNTENVKATSDASNTLTLTSESREVKQGSSAYKTVGKAPTRAEITLTNSVDISAYKKGGLHFWIYTPDYAKLGGTFTITLKDRTENSLQWKVYETRFMSEDWVEVKLYFNRAAILPSAEGTTFDYKHVNYFGITNNKDASTDYTTIIDDIRAVAALPGMTILDCDDKDNAENSATLAPNKVIRELDPKYVKDGYGAYYSNNTDRMERFTIDLPKTIDLSNYKEEGILHFWLYVKDITTWQQNEQNLRVQLGSRNDDGKTWNYGTWQVKPKNLKVGWNEMSLELSEIVQKIEITNLNLTKIGQIQLHTGSFTGNLELAIDDVRVIQSTLDEKTILDCEDTENVTLRLQNTGLEKSIVKIGNGAYYSDRQNGTRLEIKPTKTIDLSSYKKKGSLHFWLYIGEGIDSWKSNTDTKGLRVRLTSGNTSGQWNIQQSSLNKGWNKVTLELTKNSKFNDIDFSNISMIDMNTGSFGGKLYMAVDDFRVLEEIPEEEYISQSAAIRFVTTVDSLRYQKVGFKIHVTKDTWAGSNYVYSTLTGTDPDGTKVPLELSQFSECSRFFSTYAVYNIPRSAFAKDMTVTPYWITQDGTTVCGTTKSYNVRDLKAQSEK